MNDSIIVTGINELQIPNFPTFKTLEISDKIVLTSFTSKYLPFSDFNFVSLWSYNTLDDFKISNLNDNLVVQMRDYITNEPFLTYLGETKPFNTVINLLDFSIVNNLSSELKLVPEIVLPYLHGIDNLCVTEERDSFDYILSINDISNLSGGIYQSQRTRVHQFLREYPTAKLEKIELSNSINHGHILEMFYKWESLKGQERTETIHELNALKRLLKDNSHFELQLYGIFNHHILIGFAISEIVQDNYAILHFAKANNEYKGIYQYLFYMVAQELKKEGCEFLNIEQDLGILGLRHAKEQWNPVRFLKKYTINYKIN